MTKSKLETPGVATALNVIGGMSTVVGGCVF
jgi:hypothetical protein